MTGSDPTPHLRRAADVDYEPVALADGLRKGVLVGDDQDAPNVHMRRFELDPGARVPRHTNAVEHEQFVLAGEYVVGMGEETHTVSAGDALLIPAGVDHWYRNDGDSMGAFLCVVPAADDEITLRE